MTALAPRRAFLRGLITLPLVGGAVELIGNPRAVAMPVTNQLMYEYVDWLGWERRAAIVELHDGPGVDQAWLRQLECTHSLTTHASVWHRDGTFGYGRRDAPSRPSTRAALVLSAVGCDWRGAYL